MIHKDPFDRLFVAQVLEEGAVLVTRDADLLAYEVPTIAA
jgi:PIN domain nuclease of toxin-antitoxin system